MGIGSEVLRHLSNVSEREGSRGMTTGHMTPPHVPEGLNPAE